MKTRRIRDNHNIKQQRIDKSYVNRGDDIFGGNPTGMTLRNKKKVPYIPQKKRRRSAKKKFTVSVPFGAPETEEFTPDSSPEL